ncbi:MAG TPA: LAGLIDADG family homing endonuclease, partial [Candidatus Saccharimonadales bacterium]
EYNQNIIDGLVIGDGMVHKASNNKIVLLIGQDDSDYFSSEVSDLIIENCDGIKKTAWQVNTRIKSEELPKTYERSIPSRYKFGNFHTRRAFLRGLYSANGSIVSNRITLKASSFKIVEDVQQMLSSLGISSYYTINKSHEVEFDNGVYECKQNYDLNIGTLYGRQLFDKYIGFIHNYKNEKVKQSLNTKPSNKPEKTTYDIIEKEFLGKELVYDITVEAKEHTYWTGGLLVSNCGEIVLSAYDACRLLVLNLSSYVTNPFKSNATFDFKKFHQHAIVAQRLMDDVIDLEIEAIDRIIAKIKADPEPDEVKAVELNVWEKIRKMNVSGRRTGLGITALGDALAMLGIRYGAEESVDVTRKIYRALAIASHSSSCFLAKERGAFSVFDYALEKDHPYLNDIFKECSPEVKKLWKTSGRRNIANTTTAPAGSVSSQTQTTSGIEPVFMLSYVRRKKHNPSDKSARVDFVDAMGDSWQEFTVYHHGVKRWMDVTGETDIAKSPYYGATANEIDWVASVDMQAAAQESIDHSISKTCNLPETASKEIVSQVYMRAWEKGCKGFTVYRDKCRDGVLINSSESKESKKTKDGRPTGISISEAPKRHIELPCDIKKAKIQGEQWTIFVGLLNGKPYEIFGGLSKYVDIPNKFKMGKIIKNGKVEDITTYNLILGEGDDQMLIKDIANVF